ncbi:MAG: sigma-70 family RNA polymerase sigma factor [Acidimicrobiales bacterium]|nr:sigma-70 family RNA polymerase sigma factor [Acidimicrobiales bacterium]MBO0886386.1 sigma-70 family RNA polymerase sigma factor [Acidimicrobiales bacterium]MBO0893367.1 sigma-70 family RNA polymerase sigma factor [Acidimicrobiales bacterium]
MTEGLGREAFRAVYEENVGLVHGFLRARVGPNDAEDLTAETFCRAYQHLHRWEDRGVPIRAWLLRIAHNLIIERARKARAVMVPLDDHHGAEKASHEEEVGTSVEAASALAALASLPESHRTVIELRYLRDLSVTETAAVLEISEEAVRALAYRALKGLRARHLDRWSDREPTASGPARRRAHGHD